MHIPQSDTNQIEIKPFELDLSDSLKPQDKYDDSRWIYVPSEYREYRYILGTRGKNPLICIGINPSTAAPGDLDNTLKSVERIALGCGFDSFIMFNVYAQRATRPNDMDKELNIILHRENLNAFEYLLKSINTTPHIWAAWGTIIEKRPYLTDCLRDMVNIGNKYGAKWIACGKRSKAGHPHHPLYLPKSSVFYAFDIGEYVHNILSEC